MSRHVAYVGDVMATAVELAGASPPTPRDGLWSVSLVPTLTGRPQAQRRHAFLYWESYERGTGQAVRFGRWKAVRDGIGRGPVELYDLERDPGERTNVATAHPDVLAQAERHMEQAHVPAPAWTAHAR